MTALTAERRREVLETYRRASRELDEVERAEPLDVERMTALVAEKTDAMFEYQDGFPPRAISRCPFTNAEARLSIDTFDTDGLWWHWGAALRGEHDLPSSTFAYASPSRSPGRTSSPGQGRRCPTWCRAFSSIRRCAP